jgi:type 1 fimbria pilin
MNRNIKKQKLNHKYFMWFLSLTIMFSFMSTFANAQSGKVNFSGNWVLNESKSNLGDNGGRRGGGNFVAKHEANLLTVDRTRTNQNGETTTTTSKYTLDGKECVNTTGRGDSKSTAKWSADGKSLTIVTKFNFDGNERTSTEVWTLPDAKTISIAATRKNQDGEDVKTTRVYDKK